MRINFRLSDEIDPDLIQAVEKLPKRALSQTCREALRAFLLDRGAIGPEKAKRSPVIKIDLTDDDRREEDIDPDDKMDDLLSAF